MSRIDGWLMAMAGGMASHLALLGIIFYAVSVGGFAALAYNTGMDDGRRQAAASWRCEDCGATFRPTRAQLADEHGACPECGSAAIYRADIDTAYVRTVARLSNGGLLLILAPEPGRFNVESIPGGIR